MDLGDFFRLLKRHRLTLIIIPVITIIVTYFMVRKLPDSYPSSAQMATGLADQSQQLLDGSNSIEAQMTAFSNIITMMQMKKVLQQVSYQCMIHDLTSPTPFRPPSKELLGMNANARKHAVDVYTEAYKNRRSLSQWNPDEKGLDRLIGSMHYDPGSLGGKFLAYRDQSSDYVTVNFESENGQLSAFFINTLIKEFIAMYAALTKENQNKAVNFLGSILQQKKNNLDAQIEKVKEYKIRNRILNLSEQAKSMYAQIADSETKLEQAIKDVEAISQTLKGIDARFNPTDRRYFESVLAHLNDKIISTRDYLKSTTDAYVRSNFSPYYKQKMDSLQSSLTQQILANNDEYAYSPQESKNNLMLQKLSLELQLSQAKYSISVYQREIIRLNNNLTKLTPHEAVIQSYETETNIATREYEDILNRYNNTLLQSQLAVKLHQVDIAVPGAPTASKKMLLVILAGIVSEVFCLIVMFVLFYLDDSIHHPKALASITDYVVLGYLSKIQGNALNLKNLWDTNNKSMQYFKEQLRSIRFEIDQELKDGNVLAITSLAPGEGKTLLGISLAYSYSIINKRVLLIDANFDNATISQTTQPKLFLEDFFDRHIPPNQVSINSADISVMANKQQDITLLELDYERNIKYKFETLKQAYDVILIDAPAMNAQNKAKEWLLFADKVVVVFESNQTVKAPQKVLIKYLKELDGKFSGWIFNKASFQKGPTLGK